MRSHQGKNTWKRGCREQGGGGGVLDTRYTARLKGSCRVVYAAPTSEDCWSEYSRSSCIRSRNNNGEFQHCLSKAVRSESRDNHERC